MAQHISMEGLTSTEKGGVSRSISDIPPNHYMIKIQLFSELVKNKIETYHSSDFEAEGHKWKLVVYPNGNKEKGITDHLSVYLVATQVESFNRCWEVRATFRLILLDQNEDNYFTLQDVAAKRFHGTKLEHGFDKFIPLTLLNDPAKGYLVNDTCMLAAKVYVTQAKLTGKGEILSMVKDAISYKHTWKIDNFSSLTNEYLESEPFTVADQAWKILLYPKGNGIGKDNSISLFVALAEPKKLSPVTKIYTTFTIRILDQIKGVHQALTINHWYNASSSSWGNAKLVSLSYFKEQSSGLLVKNSCIVEAEVTVNGMVDALGECT